MAERARADYFSARPATPPTGIYNEISLAYSHMNTVFFDGELPSVMFSLVRKQKTAGYAWCRRYEDKASKQRAHELALNPDVLATLSTHEILAVICHEMCHIWDFENGKAKTRRTYHTKEWAAKMMSIGLHPSDDGLIGPKVTGHRMSHVIVKNGKFLQEVRRLRAMGLGFNWASAWVEGDKDKAARKESRNGVRKKYVCPKCKAAVWGKGGLTISCCGKTMVEG